MAFLNSGRYLRRVNACDLQMLLPGRDMLLLSEMQIYDKGDNIPDQ